MMFFFVVAPSSGSYHTTLVSPYGLSFTNIADVCSDVVNSDFLVKIY